VSPGSYLDANNTDSMLLFQGWRFASIFASARTTVALPNSPFHEGRQIGLRSVWLESCQSTDGKEEGVTIIVRTKILPAELRCVGYASARVTWVLVVLRLEGRVGLAPNMAVSMRRALAPCRGDRGWRDSWPSFHRSFDGWDLCPFETRLPISSMRWIGRIRCPSPIE
jgi:hypothetical protein